MNFGINRRSGEGRDLWAPASATTKQPAEHPVRAPRPRGRAPISGISPKRSITARLQPQPAGAFEAPNPEPL